MSILTDDEVEAELELLRQFDLNIKYGPCLGKKKKNVVWFCLFLVVCLTIMIARVCMMDLFLFPCGPSLVGMTRLERWERAKKFGLDPPAEVLALLQCNHGNQMYTQW